MFQGRRIRSDRHGRHLSTQEEGSKLTRKNRKVLIMRAPRDGTEITQKTPRIYAVSDFGLLGIPPKAPLPKGGCCHILRDVGGRQFISICLRVTAALAN